MKDQLIFARFAFSISTDADGNETHVRVDNSEHVDPYTVGDIFVVHDAAPGYKRYRFIITKVDSAGIWGRPIYVNVPRSLRIFQYTFAHSFGKRYADSPAERMVWGALADDNDVRAALRMSEAEKYV